MKKTLFTLLMAVTLCFAGTSAFAGGYKHHKHSSAKMDMMKKKPSFHHKMKQKHSHFKWHKKKHWHHHKPHGHGHDKPSAC